MRGQTALGIDISDSRINLVLLKRTRDGVELLKTASGSVPEEAMKNGRIKDPTVLAKAIKELKSHNKMRARQAGMSLPPREVLVQIMDVPRQVPTNIGQFVKNEVKRYITLSGKEVAMDFCGIGSGKQAGRRLLVAAADGERTTGLARACNQPGLNVGLIEPPLLAYARAFYDKKIAGRFDHDVLMAILGGGVLTLCVFRKQTIDFVRTKNISEEKAEPNKLCQWLTEQINAVIQFYDVEVAGDSGQWEITVVAEDSVRLPENAEELLKARVGNSELKVKSWENAYQDTPLDRLLSETADNVSPVAIGLAMGLLGTDGSNLRINLVPPETAEVKSLKKDTLITANIAAVVLLLMILAIGVLNFATGRVRGIATQENRTGLSRHTNVLLREQKLIDERIKQVTERLELMDRILSSRRDSVWPGILNDIRKATPRIARLTDISSENGSEIVLEGLALSYEAVHLFVKMLNESRHIHSASLVETEKDGGEGGLIRYEINCSLLPEEGK